MVPHKRDRVPHRRDRTLQKQYKGEFIVINFFVRFGHTDDKLISESLKKVKKGAQK
jgi:hypothetical protein